jgi:predicted RNA binding protein YcfA (HicA-like mRNA interferase family)
MLARLPGARAKDVIKALEQAGFLRAPQKATSHVVLRHPQTKRTTVVSVHSRELPRWLLKKIIKDAGLDENRFRELL